MTTTPTATPRYRWTLLRAGPLLLDGGSMFGVVPRVVWTRSITPDEQGRIALAHNCLLLEPVDGQNTGPVLIEAGSGDKLDAKMKAIFGLTDRTVEVAVREAGVAPETIRHAIVSHLHFDHVGGLTRQPRTGESSEPQLTFPNAEVIVQRREWDDAIANNSVMTRTYLRENLEPLRDRLRLIDSPPPFEPGHHPRKDEPPRTSVRERMTEVLPGIHVFLAPGHTWGQQAILFRDEQDRTIVFTPDILPTVHHVGAAYNMAYDVEAYMSTVNRRWFLDEAAKNGWRLLLDHEPGQPVQRVRGDGKGWWALFGNDE